ncbi:hypothetical protein ACHQM5_030455 [Ranunculus cassubicifolius]
MGLYERMGRRFEEYTPHLLMTLYFLALAIFIVFLQGQISHGGVSPLVFVLYEHLLSTVLLSILAFFERGKRPELTLNIFSWAFLVGFLQIPLGQLLLTASLGYISATFQTTFLNTEGAFTFLLAVIFRREALSFCTINGQAKFWGIIVSAIGAMIMVLWSGPKLGMISSPHELSDFAERAIGFLMVLGTVVAGASGSLLVEHVAIKYPSNISLSAMMCFSGTIQTAIITVITERNISTWKIHSVSEILIILYGGVTVTGLGYYIQTWCINKRGPVFTAAFSPLLVVFSFILETLILGNDAFLGSILGAVFVIVGLYMLLWAKADDHKEKILTISSPEGPYEQLT